MTLYIQSLPNEIFLHGIFKYLSLIDLKYGFSPLNRFQSLVSTFLSENLHEIHLTCDINHQEMQYLIENVLPSLDENHQLKSIESNHADLCLKFVDNLHRMNTIYLTKLVITSYIDIRFDVLLKLLCQCPRLNEMKLKILTNVDPSLANGRKWVRCFDKMLEINRQTILTNLDICVWCVDTTRPMNFDSKHWTRDGFYRENLNWKVQSKSDQHIEWQKSRRVVEFSRSDNAYLTLSSQAQQKNCLIS